MANDITVEEYVELCKKKYGDLYDYSHVTSLDKGPIMIICKKHGAFFDMPYSHLNCNPCFECMKENFTKI